MTDGDRCVRSENADEDWGVNPWAFTHKRLHVTCDREYLPRAVIALKNKLDMQHEIIRYPL